MLFCVLRRTCFLILLIVVMPAEAGESSHVERIFKPKFEQELRDIENFNDGSMENIFQVKVFGHLIPIPNRYVLIASEVNQHEFNSLGIIIGSIDIGSHEESGFKIKQDRFEQIEFSENRLNVKFYRLKESGSGIDQIVISDGKEYFLIQDQNSELWKEMIKAARP